MKSNRVIFLSTIFILVLLFSVCLADTTQEIVKKLPPGEAPSEIISSKNGLFHFILTKQGKLYIFDSKGNQMADFDFGKSAKKIELPSREDILFIKTDKGETIKRINLYFPQKISVSEAPLRGSANAPIEIVVFCDFQCPFCKGTLPVLKKVLKNYPDDVKIRFKHFPLRIHDYSSQAAIASMVAQDSGKFWEFHDKLFENSEQLSNEKLMEIVRELDMDPKKFMSNLGRKKYYKRLKKDVQDAINLGVNATPRIFINGVLVKALTYEEFVMLIEQALAAKNQPR